MDQPVLPLKRRGTRRRRPALSALVLLIAVGPCVAQESFEEGLRGHLDKLTKDILPGMALLVAREGKIVFQDGFGYADLGKESRVTVETKFRIGSVTKQFVAAAILQLSEEGKLSLDDKLEKFFPGFPGGDGIAVRQLLTHTSGLRSYTSKPEFLSRVDKAIPPGELIAWFREDKPDFPPGEGFSYNNSAYFLAGEIVAQVSEMSLDRYLRATFFEPLGMKETGIFVNADPPPGVALGYSMSDGKAEPALDWDMSWAGGAGALYSTVGDLFKWNEALHGGRVVQPASLKLMTTPIKLPPGVDGMSYGYGLMVASIARLPVIGHGGGLNGWSSDLQWLPSQRCTIVALANAMPPVSGHEPAIVTSKIVQKLFEDEIAALPPVKEDPNVDRESYADFAGRYDYKVGVMTVTVEDGRLYAQITGQPKLEIFPSAPDEFFWKVTEAQVKFVRDEKGAVTAARHTQGGNTFTAERLSDAPDATLTDAKLDAILGEYNYGSGAVLTVTREGNAVFAQMTGQPRFPIFAKSATEFEWRVVPAKVKFTTDKDGKVTGAVHTQGGATIEAPKIK